MAGGRAHDSAESELLGRVVSCVRVRPSLEGDDNGWEASVDAASSSVHVRDMRGKDRVFQFHRVFDSSQCQKDVYDGIGKPVVDAMLTDEGCDGAMICYGGRGMGKSHTLLEDSSTSRDAEGVMTRVVHDTLRKLYWRKFSPDRRSKDRPRTVLEASIVAVCHSGVVVDLLKVPSEQSKAPTVPIKASDLRPSRQWVSCVSASDFETRLNYALQAYRTKDKVLTYRGQRERIKFVVAQIRLVNSTEAFIKNEEKVEFLSRTAFVLVAPSDAMLTEGPVLTGTHLSASMLRLKAIVDSLTGIGSKNQIVRANASLADILSAPLGSSRSVGVHKKPFVVLVACLSPSIQNNEVLGLLSFAERIKHSQLLHAECDDVSTVRRAQDSHAHASTATSEPADVSPHREAPCKDIVAARTPASAIAINKLSWPLASPSSFEAGLEDFGRIKDELETIWTGLREAERYHGDALLAAETELHDVEAATRRAGARATEMKRIITSLKEEIRNQKNAAMETGRHDEGSLTESRNVKMLQLEISQLREQVGDEEELRRQAEAAFATLDDECAALKKRISALEMQLRSAQANGDAGGVSASEGARKGVRTRNARIQCSLQSSTSTAPASIGRSHQSADAAPLPAIAGGDDDQNDSSVTIGSAIQANDPAERGADGPAERLSLNFSDGPNFPQKHEEECTTPTSLPRGKAEASKAKTAKAEVAGLDETSDHEALKEARRKGKRVNRKLIPDDFPSFSSIDDIAAAEDGEAASSDDTNPVVLIVAINMYKGHVVKLHVRSKDSPTAVAKQFVKAHNLPDNSVRNLVKLIRKNAAAAGIKLKDANAKEGILSKEEGGGQGGGRETPQGGLKVAKPLTPLTPPEAHQSDERPSSAPASSRSNPESPSRPLRPVDMYRFIN